MKRKNFIQIDFNVFAEYAEKLDELDADLIEVFTDAMEQAGQTVADDTIEALSPANLPAQGKYSSGDTEASVIREPKVTASGMVLEMGLGFDKTKPGAGGWLITGTPKMQPDAELERIYGQKRYTRTIVEQIEETLQDAIDDIMGG